MVIEHGSLLTIGTVTFRAFYDGMPQELSAVISPKRQGDSKPAAAGETEGSSDTSTITRVDTGKIGGPVRSGKPQRVAPKTN